MTSMIKEKKLIYQKEPFQHMGKCDQVSRKTKWICEKVLKKAKTETGNRGGWNEWTTEGKRTQWWHIVSTQYLFEDWMNASTGD